jgi:hypothetical protein
MRTVHSSPQALWVSGQIQSPTRISVSDLGNYGTEGQDPLQNIPPHSFNALIMFALS